jgi:hypothetical protein
VKFAIGCECGQKGQLGQIGLLSSICGFWMENRFWAAITPIPKDAVKNVKYYSWVLWLIV